MTSVFAVWSLLSSSQRVSAIVLFGWMLVGMALEMLGIGLIVPALALLVGNPGAAPAGVAGMLQERLGGVSQERLLLWGVTAIIAIYVLKTAVLLFINWQQHRFVAGLNADLSSRLFSAYMRQPWPFHLQRSSAVLIRNLEAISSITEAVGWALVLVAETLVLAGIVLLLGWFEPLGALGVALVTGIAAFVLDQSIRGRVALWGRLRQEHAALRMKHMQEGLHGVKPALLRGRQETFLRRFTESSAAFARMTAKKMFIGNLPRLWFELVAVVSLSALVGIMAAEGKSMQSMVPIVGLFAAAAFRVLPSVNRLATALHTLRFNDNALETLRGELALELCAAPASPSAPLPPLQREIRVEDVSYRYPDAAEDALKAIDMTVARGAAVGLVGSSGAGKSTLIDVILGLLPPTKGCVFVDGTDIRANPLGWQRMVGYVPQSIYLIDDSIRRNIAFGVPDDAIDEAAVERALRAACLHDFVISLPQRLDSCVGEHGVRLSGGQRQRIGIARALYDDPAILVLDEATSSLDLVTERQIMDEISALQGEKTLIIVSHRDSTVAHCDVIYQMEKGTLRRVAATADA
jgi:ABC-type multidrug transport system fused ATPase/permease subunit